MSETFVLTELPSRILPRSFGKFNQVTFWGTLQQLIFPNRQFAFLRTYLPKTYQEPFDRMLHGCFNLLVEYVEKECAKEEYLEHSEAYKKQKRWYWPLYVHSPKLGITYLKERMELGKSVEAEASSEMTAFMKKEAEIAKRILVLYFWWFQRNIKIAQLEELEATDLKEYSRMSEELAKEEISKFIDLVFVAQFLWF